MFPFRKSVSTLSDEQLVRDFANPASRSRVFTEIMDRYKQRIYFHVRNIVVDHDDANDAAQNTFIKVWENLSDFRGESKLFSWIYRIATNEALTVLRKKRPHVSLEDALPELVHTTSGLSSLSGDEISRRLEEAMSTLPLKQKLVFYLKYIEELSYEEISGITETSEGALKASYFHAVRKIEHQLNTQL